MKNSKILLFTAVAAMILLAAVVGCKKTGDILPIPPAQSSFQNISLATYYVTNVATSTFKIPVGITASSNVDRKVVITVTSPTGAVSGTQYTIPSATVTIPAGKVLDSLTVNGIFAAYSTGRIDTLVFTITGGDVPASGWNSVYKLVLRRYCDVISTNLIGDYTHSKDYYAGTPSAASYDVVVSNWTSTGATTATVLLKNFSATLDNGFGPFTNPSDPAVTGITATLDWTNPANFTVSIASQPYVSSLYTYGASTISGSGTFSSCDQSFNIAYTVKVSAGNFTGTSTIMLR